MGIKKPAGTKHEARILVISTNEFKESIQFKALKQKRTLSEVIRTLLEQWLREK